MTRARPNTRPNTRSPITFPAGPALLFLLAFLVLLAGCTSSIPGKSRSASEQRSLNRALTLAAYYGDTSAVRRLLAAGTWGDSPFAGTDADRTAFGIKLIGMEEWRPLHAAAQSGHANNRVAIARLLLDAGADPDVDDGYGATPLYMAIRRGNDDVAMLLLDWGANVNTSTKTYIDGIEGTPLHAAVESGNPDLVRKLLARGARVETNDSWDYRPLLAAVAHGNLACVELLLAADADVNARNGWVDSTALLHATEPPGNAAIVRVLLAAGADVNARQVRPASPFLDEQDPKTIHTPLLKAATGGPEIVRLLLDAGADTQARNEKGDTPLHVAIGGEAMVARMLLAAGAFTDVKNNDGNTPLHLFIERALSDPNADASLAKSLVDAGAPTDAKNNTGQTPLDLVPEDQRDSATGKALVEVLRAPTRDPSEP